MVAMPRRTTDTAMRKAEQTMLQLSTLQWPWAALSEMRLLFVLPTFACTASWRNMNHLPSTMM